MHSVSKNVLQVICDMMSVNDAGRLKMVCTYFNQAIEIINVRMYSCAVDKNKLPMNTKHNCLKISARYLKHKFIMETLKQEFYSPSYNLFAICIWGQLKDDNLKKNGKKIIPTNFISTTIQIQETVNFIEEGRKAIWKVDKYNLSVSHIKYIEKELRYVQEECWNFPYPHTTSLELKNTFDELNVTGNPIIGDLNNIVSSFELDSTLSSNGITKVDCYLVLRCVAGDVFDKTIDALYNTLERFGFKLN